MYKFKGLKKETYSQNDLSSVAMLYNGKLIEDEIDGYQTLTVKGREYIAFETEDAGNVAGKDGVIRTVFSTLTPHGVKEYCFKVPSAEEAAHDYLWRFWSALPARGNISIFNSSFH